MIRTSQQISWDRDYAERIHPTLMTGLLHQAVPVLKWTDWRIQTVRWGYCETLLPLSVPSTNQHGTHQAAMISLSADYTGGMALTTLLTGTPLTGIHRGTPDESASLWLVGMDVKYEAPSTSDLRGTCRIDAKTAKRIQSRFFSGRVVLATLEVEFWSEDGDRVAVATMRYFAQATERLLQQRPDGQSSALAKLNLKTSARIIAGLRAMSHLSPQTTEAVPATRPSPPQRMGGRTLRIDRPHDRVAAGSHGMLQAERLQGVLPQLATMVAARTGHGDELIRSRSPLEQLVLLGSGLDMRPVRLAKQLVSTTVFELDLPVMLEERQRAFERLERQYGDSIRKVERHQIPADFLKDDVGRLLQEHFAFSETSNTLVIYEGCSMYFSREQNIRLLRSIRSRLRNPDSRLWMDCVTPEVISGTTADPNIHRFVEQMEGIGERFVFGPANPVSFLSECGLRCAATITAGEYLGSSDPTMAEYRFLVARRDIQDLMQAEGQASTDPSGRH